MEGLKPGGACFNVFCRRCRKRVVFRGLAFFEVFEDFLEESFERLVKTV
jgi:hypothetical protein